MDEKGVRGTINSDRRGLLSAHKPIETYDCIKII